MINGEKLCSEMVLLWVDDSGVMLGHGVLLNAGPHMILKSQTVDMRPWPYLNITFLFADCLLLKLFCNVMFLNKIKQNKTVFLLSPKYTDTGEQRGNTLMKIHRLAESSSQLCNAVTKMSQLWDCFPITLVLLYKGANRKLNCFVISWMKLSWLETHWCSGRLMAQFLIQHTFNTQFPLRSNVFTFRVFQTTAWNWVLTWRFTERLNDLYRLPKKKRCHEDLI